VSTKAKMDTIGMVHDEHEMDDDDDYDDEGIVTAPPLYNQTIFFRQTRKRGKVFKTVIEQYIRDDLGMGCYFMDDGENKKTRRVKDAVVGKPCDIPNTTTLVSLLKNDDNDIGKTTLVICDTNVLLHNLDVLEQSPIRNLVIPQTALQECRSNQLTAYDRTVELLRAVGKERLVLFFADQHHVETAHVIKSISKNDENDARIRLVAHFFGTKLRGSSVSVILLTDDKASRVDAQKESKGIYVAKSVRSYMQQLEKIHPSLHLSDLVANYGKSSHEALCNNEEHFPRHLEANKLQRGVQSGAYHRGVFRSSSDDLNRVMIRNGDDRVAVTILNWTDRNRAIDGDVVAIKLNDLDQWLTPGSNVIPVRESNKVEIASETAEPTLSEITNVPDYMKVDDYHNLRPTGKVVGILRRNFSTYCGSIYSPGDVNSSHETIAKEFQLENPDGSTTCVFYAVDKNIPPILIQTTQREHLMGMRIEVAMDSWPSNSPYPLGHYVRILGKAGSKDVETEVLLKEHKIPHEPFPAKVLACLPPTDYKIEYTSDRADLRHIPVVSIDPPGCKDIDDALHCVVLPNGNYQVGVHIADVTHYVTAGSAIDLEAANRSTSTYLVNRRLDMLPSLLTTDLCSLKGNVDRYAFSVLWEVTPDANIINVDFKKSIIHSIGALTYQQAQAMINLPDDKQDVKVGAVQRLASLARLFRKRRIEAGALTLSSPEVKFVLDQESLNPTDVQKYQLLEANALVEEFMLLANVTVSKKILRHYPTLSVLRRHVAPNRSMFRPLISKARCRGFEINIEDSKTLADSLDAAVMVSDPYFNELLRILSTRCMSPAQYFCSGEFKPTEWHHYGLAAPVYTHFTSPIRRYADVCVHRLLAAAIGVAPLPVHLSSKSYLHDLTANMNRRHRAAQLAGRASVQLHTLIFFSSEGAKEEDAYVLDVETDSSKPLSLLVLVPRYGIEGRIQFNDIQLNDPHLSRDAEHHFMIYKGTKIQVFDKVKIKISVRSLHHHQRELVIILLKPDLEVALSNEKRLTKRPRKI
jgi:exosome complex exonuclease DIS3/RRP44